MKKGQTGHSNSGDIKGTRLQLLMNTQVHRQLSMLQAYLGGTSARTGIYKELPKIQVIELALHKLFKENEEPLLKQLLGV